MTTIDLNADLGEGCEWDEELLALVSSASIACGAHAGDERTMRAAIESALRHGVSVGAHPGYADRAGFGRMETGATPGEIRSSVLAQLETFAAICADSGTTFRHVKPHGAMYNRGVREPVAAESIARAVSEFDPSLTILCMPGSRLYDAASAAGLKVAREAFLDRAYAAPDALVPRTEPGAVIENPDTAAARAERMVLSHLLTSLDGAEHRIEADSLCVHGDNPRAVAILHRVRTRLGRAAVTIAPFDRA